MAEESFLLTALPHSAADGAPFHLSLFVTHRLTPDGPGGPKAVGKVSDFPRVADWTGLLSTSTLTLTGRTAGGATVTLPATMLLDGLDASLWPRVFPPGLDVRPWRVPDHTAVPWRTFAAHRMQSHALLVHFISLVASPTEPPGVEANPLTGSLLSALGLGRHEGRVTVDDVLDPDMDRSVTKRLDDLAGNGFLGRGSSGPGAAPGLVLLSDLHRAKCYYARPEEEAAYRDRPVPGAVGPPVVKPEPDFHERASLLGDLAPLLRKLGLVIDVRVESPSLLANLVSVQAQLDVPGLANTVVQQPHTACEVVGTGFYAVASSGETSRGMVRLGDEGVYRVLDLDPDASALKLEQYVRNVPRMMAVEINGDSVNSAPASLRGTGFAVARVDRAQQLHDRLDDAASRDAVLLAGKAPPLHAEEITRGIRLEVWDDVSGDWHSLHQRRLDVEVEGAGAVLTDEPDAGFLQGASLTTADGVPGAPVNAHEVLAGWDGWSLSAPRPGKVVVHENGTEKVVDAPDVDPDPVNPVASTTRVEPGSLPRLRYGRRYAFRAWTVDLAGNSSPHVVGNPTPPDGPLVDAAQSLSMDRLARLARDATIPFGPSGGAEDDGRALVAAVRGRLRDRRPTPPAGPQSGSGVHGTAFDTDATVTGERALDRLVLSRRAALGDRKSAPGPSRLETLQRHFVDAAITEQHLLRPTESDTPAAVDAAALLSALSTADRIPKLDLLLALSEQVTTPRPFLRWDPVLEPTVVPRHPYSEAESLLTLAVRSGVDLGATPGDQPAVVPPAVYVPQTLAAHPTLDLRWRVESERHVAPPKSSQLECELHGRFDEAFGTGSALDVRRMLAVALREAGTFLDETVADLEEPGKRNPVQDITFHTSPTAEVPAVTLPGDLPRGEPLTPGQYVVHGGETVEVPYLPDPLATGISLVFPDAGGAHELTGLLAVEGVTLGYEGTWPTPTPYRLVLAAGDELGARVEGHVLTVTVPPGEQLRLRLSSTIDRARLDDLGIWRSLPDALRDNPLVREAAVDGWFWWLTPAATVRLVHAVPRPVEAPRPTLLIPVRQPGDTAVALAGGVDLHGPSTERLDVEAGVDRSGRRRRQARTGGGLRRRRGLPHVGVGGRGPRRAARHEGWQPAHPGRRSRANPRRRAPARRHPAPKHHVLDAGHHQVPRVLRSASAADR